MSRQHSFGKLDGYILPTISEESLHLLLQRLTLAWIKDFKAKIPLPPRHRSFLVAYHKGFKLKNRLISLSPSGKALCLLKTQFAKKPKNPV